MIELDVSKNKTLIFDCEVQDMVNCKAALHQMQALYGEIYGLMLLKMAQKWLLAHKTDTCKIRLNYGNGAVKISKY